MMKNLLTVAALALCLGACKAESAPPAASPEAPPAASAAPAVVPVAPASSPAAEATFSIGVEGMT